MRSWPLWIVLAAASSPAWGRKTKVVETPDPDAVAAGLLGAALTSDEAYRELEVLADDIGARISGSAALDRAIAWGAAEMKADGLVVTTEPVMVPKWVRGPAKAYTLENPADAIDLLALGNSVSTPAGGLEAPIVVLSSFDQLKTTDVKGKIVVWNAPFTDYGATVKYRWDGASQASRAGAVASLTRSVTPTSLDSPHTGNQRYADDVTPIPTAAISLEDATRLARRQERGLKDTIHLEISASNEADAPSANVVGELRGRDLPDEVIVLGCHLDSWDVGQGAQDDGAGCVTVMQAGALLAALPVAPRRTVRVVLFTNEENGLAGGKAYYAAHSGEKIVAAVEDDTGSGAPLGFQVEVDGADGLDEPASQAVVASLGPLLPWLAPVGATTLTTGGAGADISVVVAHGAVGFGLEHDMTGYWPIHHTDADTFDKVDPALVRKNVAAVTMLAYALAETLDLPARKP